MGWNSFVACAMAGPDTVDSTLRGAPRRLLARRFTPSDLYPAVPAGSSRRSRMRVVQAGHEPKRIRTERFGPRADDHASPRWERDRRRPVRAVWRRDDDPDRDLPEPRRGSDVLANLASIRGHREQ
jgi:hypothetical protein